MRKLYDGRIFIHAGFSDTGGIEKKKGWVEVKKKTLRLIGVKNPTAKKNYIVSNISVNTLPLGGAGEKKILKIEPWNKGKRPIVFEKVNRSPWEQRLRNHTHKKITDQKSLELKEMETITVQLEKELVKSQPWRQPKKKTSKKELKLPAKQEIPLSPKSIFCEGGKNPIYCAILEKDRIVENLKKMKQKKLEQEELEQEKLKLIVTIAEIPALSKLMDFDMQNKNSIISAELTVDQILHYIEVNGCQRQPSPTGGIDLSVPLVALEKASKRDPKVIAVFDRTGEKRSELYDDRNELVNVGKLTIYFPDSTFEIFEATNRVPVKKAKVDPWKPGGRGPLPANVKFPIGNFVPADPTERHNVGKNKARIYMDVGEGYNEARTGILIHAGRENEYPPLARTVGCI